MNKAERLVQAIHLLGYRPALIIVARHEANEVARQAQELGFYQPFDALHGVTIHGVPIAVADIQETVAMSYDLTMARVLF